MAQSQENHSTQVLLLGADAADDLDVPVANRKPMREKKPLNRYRDFVPPPPRRQPKPKKYSDILPCPPANLPPSSFEVRGPQLLPSSSTPTQILNHAMPCSPRNCFGLIRRYTGEGFPSHDADEHLTFEDLCDQIPSVGPHASADQATSSTPPSSISNSKFFPYPNLSSLRLGHWYWNDGTQKTQANFRRLIDIIGHPSFIPADVIHHGWTRINTVLAENQDSGEWVDAADEGWQLKQIEIHVPFHSDAEHPGPRLYHGVDLYHRSLVAVMKERVSDSSYFRHFHIEPYELLWKSPSDQQSPEIRIHGELYTSQSFLRAHDDLQKSDREPGCQLTRVICAFMFWSDATHLTSFGNAKLWPVYIYFGNESKYRRGKPSNNSCNHVAYLEKMR